MKAVILAGGHGTRFWPMSRKNVPKQCLPITSDKPMIVETIDRLKPLTARKDVYISTGKNLEKPLKQLLPDVNYIIEPMGRNTAAAIGLSAISIDDDIMFIETADHTYSDIDAYLEHLKAGIEMAKQDKIVLIGIKPGFAHTGYGYIHQGELIKDSKIKVYKIKEFKEKPDLNTAEKYLKDGDYLWNSGMFIAKNTVIIDAIKEHMPELYQALMNIKKSGFDENILKEEFEKLENVSVDYGIMEKAKNTVVIRGEFPWDDVGDWKAMERIHKKDKKGNVIFAKHEGDAKNCIIIGHKISIETEGIKDIVIVDTEDSLLVCNKDKTQDVKKIVEVLEKDAKLKKFTQDMNKPEKHNISIDSKNIEIKGEGIVATVGVSNLYIEKSDKVRVIKKK